MKWGTPDHPKTATLAGILGLKRYSAVGLLELLWHWTSKYRPTGSLEGVSEYAIAAACEWDGEPARLVQAFEEAGWIDRGPVRMVHGWSEHAENAVHNTLARAVQLFADGTVPKTGHLDSKEREPAQRALANLKQEHEAAASKQPGAPVPMESPRGPRGVPKASPRLAVAVAVAEATNERTTTTPPTPAAQRPLDGLIGLVPGPPAARFENREALRQAIELLVEITGDSFAYWCRAVTCRKVKGRADYSQARVSLDGISDPHAERSLLDARAQIAGHVRDRGITDARVQELESRIRRTA